MQLYLHNNLFNYTGLITTLLASLYWNVVQTFVWQFNTLVLIYS